MKIVSTILLFAILCVVIDSAVASSPKKRGCDCDFIQLAVTDKSGKKQVKARGCTIYRAAPANQACRCTKDKNDDNCSGALVKCKDPKSAKCRSPDDSKEACILGGGNCGGYA